MAHIQQQIRENSMELQDYLRELQDWEAKVKAKDQKLKGSAAPDSAAPPVRGQLKAQLRSRDASPTVVQTRSTSQDKKEEEGRKKKHNSAAGHTYDYFRDKWDKFDLDKALAEADEESSQSKRVPKASTNTPVEPQPSITRAAATPVPQMLKAAKSQFALLDGTASKQSATLEELPPEKAPDALSEKEEGNRLFKAGRYGEAFEAYSRSLALAPTSIAYANRAMAALKLERFEGAEEDCTAAIELDSHYSKAYTRRGKAYSHLGKLLEAANDFEFALRLEPHNKELLHEYTAARAACQNDAKLSVPSTPVRLPLHGNVPLPAKVNSDDHSAAENSAKRRLGAETSKKAGKGSADKSSEKGALHSSHRSEAREGSEDLEVSTGRKGAVDEQVAESKRSQAERRGGSKVEASPMRRLPIEENVSTTVKKTVSKGAFPSEQDTQKKAGSEQTGIPADTPPSTDSVRRGERATGASDAARLAAERLQRTIAENVTAPRNAYEFEAQWKGFRDDLAAKAKLLKTLPLSNLAAFFKESLQAPLLCDMLRVVSNEMLPSDARFAADLLEKLSEVPRFGMTVMFITSKDKASLRSIWEAHAKDASIPGEIQKRLELCRKKYRL